MSLDVEQQGWLARALAALAQGDMRRFEDSLWLGFGDQWHPIRRSLTTRGYVRRRDDGAYELDERGEALLIRLAREDANGKSGSRAGVAATQNGTNGTP